MVIGWSLCPTTSTHRHIHTHAHTTHIHTFINCKKEQRSNFPQPLILISASFLLLRGAWNLSLAAYVITPCLSFRTTVTSRVDIISPFPQKVVVSPRIGTFLLLLFPVVPCPVFLSVDNQLDVSQSPLNPCPCCLFSLTFLSPVSGRPWSTKGCQALA